MRILFFILLLLALSPCWADVFKSVDPQGNVTYSDAPLNGKAEKIPLPTPDNVQTNENAEKNAVTPESETALEENEAGESKAAIGNEKKPYKQFEIVYPANEETIQNQPVINVQIKVDPALQEGDMIQIYLDGAPWGAPQANTHFQFNRPDRGTHQLSARLIDNKRSVLKEAGPHTIYIHQANIPNSPPKPL